MQGGDLLVVGAQGFALSSLNQAFQAIGIFLDLHGWPR